MTLTTVCCTNESIHSLIPLTGSNGILPALQTLCQGPVVRDKWKENLTYGGWVGSLTWNITEPPAGLHPQRYIMDEGLGSGNRNFLWFSLCAQLCQGFHPVLVNVERYFTIFLWFVCLFLRNTGGKEVNSSFVVPKNSVGFWIYLPRALNQIYWTLKSGCPPFLTTAHLRTFSILPLTILSPGKIFLCHPDYISYMT